MSESTACVVLITDGTIVEFPPEVYSSRVRARLEAERWAWVLSGGGWADVSIPFPDRWQIGDRDVRLVIVPGQKYTSDTWVGTYWTEDGYPDPEAILLDGRDTAQAWVIDGPNHQFPDERLVHPWMLAATYQRGDEEAYAVAWLAKVVGS